MVGNLPQTQYAIIMLQKHGLVHNFRRSSGPDPISQELPVDLYLYVMYKRTQAHCWHDWCEVWSGPHRSLLNPVRSMLHSHLRDKWEQTGDFREASIFPFMKICWTPVIERLGSSNCPKNFNNKRCLKNHVYDSNSGIRRYSLCPLTFKRNCSLRSHMLQVHRRHEDEKVCVGWLSHVWWNFHMSTKHKRTKDT